jgi:hypothetical protein
MENSEETMADPHLNMIRDVFPSAEGCVRRGSAQPTVHGRSRAYRRRHRAALGGAQ